VIPYGSFDWQTDCHLVIEELGLEFEVQAGVPIFFPSALFTHYNTRLISMGMRGSISAWTGASVFQWAELGGRAVSQLTQEEQRAYIRAQKDRLAAGFARFPRIDVSL
jgi:hypothetical protein